MITENNLSEVLLNLGFNESDKIFTKEYADQSKIEVDFKSKKIKYSPIDDNFDEEFPNINKQSKGFVIHRKTTLDFLHNENFVCLICIHLLLQKGYQAKHIVIEPAFKVGHVNKPSYGDILVFDKLFDPLILIENKTYGSEFSAEWNLMQKDGGQLFSYLAPLASKLKPCKNIVLLAFDYENGLITKNHIITLIDNEKRLKDLENAKSFENAQGKLFEVWDQTYGKSFATKGLFEDDIQPYSVGKEKYTLKDLKPLSHAEIKPIYHEFATILRNHAITDFEHSFYILIDLFLCKIIDEIENPNNLQFYYKGTSIDTPKEYCNRLLKLYQLGKKKLFKVDVVNKDEKDINQIFEDTNRVSVKNGLYKEIIKLFEEIRFYNIKKFNFIDVENKEEFEQNFQILIKVSALIQDINLSASETNHFFGDLFEGLLSKNVHQTEGQFFTPLPIVNFIIKSLPEFFSDKVKVLDYACGAGHFLTEFIKAYSKAQIYGIEKSQPLSQVAKIATVINGCIDSHIIFKDSLSNINTNEKRYEGFEKESFDCIIANPPYSVKGFLDTLDKTDRNQYELIESVEEKTFSKNNSIECFFIERAFQFLKRGGLLGIVLPSSILTNDKIYIKTREILLEHFNILSIVLLNSRTFSSTGTNTIILFAQKVNKNAQGLIDTFCDKKDITEYTTWEAITSYITKQGYAKDDYFSFMQDNVLSEALENSPIFKEYKSSFKHSTISNGTQKEWFKKSDYFNNLASIESKKYSTKEYKKYFNLFLDSEEYKKLESEEYREQFKTYANNIERNKLKVFIQIFDNTVAILQSPPETVKNKSNKTEIIQFLGYDWSNRKGNEGIKYITNQTQENEQSDDESEEEFVQSINSIKFIDTPLYNPNDKYDNTKYCYAIRNHIINSSKKYLSFYIDNKSDKPFCESFHDLNLLNYENLSNLIDFSRSKFNIEIKINEKREQIQYNTKYQNIKLSDLILSIETGSRPEGGVSNITSGILSLGGEHIDNHNGYINISEPKYVPLSFYKNAQKGKIRKNDILLCKDGALSGKIAIVRNELNNKEAMVNEHIFIIRCKDLLTQNYLFYFLHSNIGQKLVKSKITGSAQGGINKTNILSLLIPLPPIEIQQQIVDECTKIDEEYNTAILQINDFKAKIESTFKNLINNIENQYQIVDLKDVCNDIFAGGDAPTKDNLRNQIIDEFNVPVYSNGTGSNALYGYTNIKRVQHDSVTISARGTIGYTEVRKAPFFPIVRLIVAIPNNKINLYYMKYILNFTEFEKSGSSIPQLTVPIIKKTKIPLPPINIQNKIVNECFEIQREISILENTIKNTKDRKQDILNKYLN